VPKVLIKVAREEKGAVERSFVLLNDRVMPFENGDEVNVYVQTETSYGVTVYCHGDTGGSVTVDITRATGNVIDPLKVALDEDDDVEHASDRFTVQ
jgi:hypothetical protein